LLQNLPLMLPPNMSILKLLSVLALATSLSTATPVDRRASHANQAITGALAVSSIENYGGSAIPSKFFQGDGSVSDGWPAHTDWISFNTMFTMNLPNIMSSCSVYNTTAPSTSEIRALYTAIQKTAITTKVDHRFILAIILQESGGCPRATTTISSSGVSNPGLMQDHAGTASCNSNGKIQTPCPDDTIQDMVNEGTAGTVAGEGLAEIINNLAGLYGDVAVFYKAARYYNAGEIPKDGDLGAPGATRCYASDIANRLIGWTSSTARTCTLDD